MAKTIKGKTTTKTSFEYANEEVKLSGNEEDVIRTMEKKLGSGQIKYLSSMIFETKEAGNKRNRDKGNFTVTGLTDFGKDLKSALEESYHVSPNEQIVFTYSPKIYTIYIGIGKREQDVVQSGTQATRMFDFFEVREQNSRGYKMHPEEQIKTAILGMEHLNEYIELGADFINRKYRNGTIMADEVPRPLYLDLFGGKNRRTMEKQIKLWGLKEVASITAKRNNLEWYIIANPDVEKAFSEHYKKKYGVAFHYRNNKKNAQYWTELYEFQQQNRESQYGSNKRKMKQYFDEMSENVVDTRTEEINGELKTLEITEYDQWKELNANEKAEHYLNWYNSHLDDEIEDMEDDEDEEQDMEYRAKGIINTDLEDDIDALNEITKYERQTVDKKKKK